MAAPRPAKTVLPIVFAIGLLASIAVLFSVHGALPRQQSRASDISTLEAEITLARRDLEEARRAHRSDEARAKELELAHLAVSLAQAKQRP